MRIAVLGPLEIVGEEHVPVVVAGAKERLLVAALIAAAPDVVSADALTETLWDGDPPPSARKSLQAHVVRLRSALEPDRPRGSSGRYVVRRGRGYALALERSAVDALHIGDLAARGHALLASGQPAEAARELEAAVELWRGPPYADWPDAPFAETERRRLVEVRAGAVGALLEAQLQLGRHAEVLPEARRLVAEEPLREQWWQLLMLALYRSGRQADALAAGRRVRALLADELGAEPGPALTRMTAAVLAHDPALAAPDLSTRVAPGSHGASAAAPGSCPYKGLASYQVEDAPLFHGRRGLVSGLVGRLVDASLLVVSGPSGAGKSSVVRAGLIPALAAGVLPDSRAWRPVALTPGRDPVDTLAELTGDAPPEQPVLLVVDQFEELWSPGIDPAERTAFLDAVVGLIDDHVVVRCVAVVRGDHVGRLAEHAAFTERLDATVVLVPALSDAELRDIVREPAVSVGLQVDPELVAAVVADVLGRPGALPLLSTALVGTWERREGHRLTLGGYLGAGGVAGALTRSAEAAYAALDDEGRNTARRLLVRLADVDDGGALVRRRVPLDEMGLSEPGRREVVETFVGRRLLAVDGDRLEVAHEALLTGWPRLVLWLEDDAAGRAVRRHLGPAAREWDGGGRPDDELYRGARLAAALDWAATVDAELTPVERQFLDASRGHAEAELTEARNRADREAAGRHRTRRLAGGLAAVLVVALVSTVLAVGAQRRAQDASLVADANRLAALSTTAGTLDVSLLLAAQAVRLADTPETQDGLLAALAEHGRAEAAVSFGGDPYEMDLTDGGRVLFFGTSNEPMTWRVGSSARPAVLDISADWMGWRVAAPSPTDALLLAAGQGDRGPWLRTIAPDGSIRLSLDGPAVGGLPLAAAFSRDGRRIHLLVALPGGDAPDTGTRWSLVDIDAGDGTVQESGIGGTFPGPVDVMAIHIADDGSSAAVRDTTGTVPPTLVRLADGRTAVVAARRPARSLDVKALPSGAAELWDDGVVTVVDADGTPIQHLEVHQEPVRDVVVAPDGTWAVTAGDGDGTTVVLWDVDPSTGRWSQREVLTGHGSDVVDVLLDGDRRLFTMSRDHTIIIWDMSPDGGFGRSYPSLGDRWISNRPQWIETGRLLVAPTRPGASSGPVLGSGPGPETLSVAATFFDPTTGAVVAEVELGDTVPGFSFGSSVAVSPDRSMVAVTWGLGTTVLDTETRDVLAEIVLPANGRTDPDGRPLPATIVWCAGWTPDGSTLLLGADEGDRGESNGGYLAVVDAETWEVTGTRIDIGSPQNMEVSPDGRVLAVTSASADEIVVLDAASLEVERTLPLAAGDRGGDLSFSPDGRLLASGGEYGLLHVFDVATWDSVGGPAPAHDAGFLQVEWLSDNRTVVTSGGDGTVSLFDVERGLVRGRPLRASAEAGRGYAHLVPGATEELVVLGGNRTGWRYPMDSSVWLAEACAIVGRDLTRAEWNRYLPGRDQVPTCTDLP